MFVFQKQNGGAGNAAKHSGNLVLYCTYCIIIYYHFFLIFIIYFFALQEAMLI